MKRVLVIMTALTLSVILSGCNNKDSGQPVVPAKVEQKKIDPSRMNDSERAVAFLAAIQDNDKKMMYEISGLTPQMVDESREILTHAAKYKQSKKERAETEHALRMSGSIDFYLKKLTRILPKSAQLQSVKTTQDVSGKNSRNIHDIKITYRNIEDGLVDKSGKKAREIVVRLQQIRHVVKGQTLQEFVFDYKDFEKMADKDFVVLSYF